MDRKSAMALALQLGIPVPEALAASLDGVRAHPRGRDTEVARMLTTAELEKIAVLSGMLRE
jgi:hypothetical protein